MRHMCNRLKKLGKNKNDISFRILVFWLEDLSVVLAKFLKPRFSSFTTLDLLSSVTLL
jgi:hypothetical protein